MSENIKIKKIAVKDKTNTYVEGDISVDAVNVDMGESKTLIDKINEINEETSKVNEIASNALLLAENIQHNSVPTNHAVNDRVYGIGTCGVYGHVKVNDDYTSLPDYGRNASNGYALSVLAGQQIYSFANNAISNKAPSYHASTNTNYGTGHSGAYGHVKLMDNYSSAPNYGYNNASGVGVSLYAAQNMYQELKGVEDRVSQLESGRYILAGTLNYNFRTDASGLLSKITTMDHASNMSNDIYIDEKIDLISNTDKYFCGFRTLTNAKSYYYKIVHANALPYLTWTNYPNIGSSTSSEQQIKSYFFDSNACGIGMGSSKLTELDYSSNFFLPHSATGPDYFSLRSNSTLTLYGSIYLYEKESGYWE